MPRLDNLEVPRRHLQLRQPDTSVRQSFFKFRLAGVSTHGRNVIRARLVVGNRTHAAPGRLPEVFRSANVAAVFRSCWVSFCHCHFTCPLPWALTPRSRSPLRGWTLRPPGSRPSPRCYASMSSSSAIDLTALAVASIALLSPRSNPQSIR